jgi:hypothetical protein
LRQHRNRIDRRGLCTLRCYLLYMIFAKFGKFN